MRYILSIVSLVLLTSCSGSSTTTNNGPAQTAEIDLLEQFEDFSGHMAADGSKGVFTSLRDDSLAHTFLFDSTLTPAQIRLDDRLGLVPGEGRESLAGLSDSGNFVVTSRVILASNLSQVIAAHFSGSAQATITLEAGHSINDLVFARGSDTYFAYVDRLSNLKTVIVIKLTGDATAVTLSEVGRFENQGEPSLIFVNGALQLASVGTLGGGQQFVKVQSFDGTVWTTVSENTVAISAQDLDNPTLFTQAGLLTPQTALVPRVRKKLGTLALQTSDSAELVSISDNMVQSDVFQSALTYDWSSANYLSDEPISLANISGTLDGEYILESSVDGFACTNGSRQWAAQKLVRRSDMKVVTFMVARVDPGTVWTDIITKPCSIIDNSIGDGVVRLLGATISRAELVSFDGTYFVVLLNSFVSGDQELRLARFKLDWDAGVASEITFTEVSAHPRS